MKALIQQLDLEGVSSQSNVISNTINLKGVTLLMSDISIWLFFNHNWFSKQKQYYLYCKSLHYHWNVFWLKRLEMKIFIQFGILDLLNGNWMYNGLSEMSFKEFITLFDIKDVSEIISLFRMIGMVLENKCQNIGFLELF